MAFLMLFKLFTNILYCIQVISYDKGNFVGCTITQQQGFVVSTLSTLLQDFAGTFSGPSQNVPVTMT